MNKIREAFGIAGKIRIITRRVHDGTMVYDSGWQKNIVTNYALDSMALWLTGTNNVGYNAVTFPAYMELGTGSGTVASTDTALFDPVATTLAQVSQMNPVDGAANEAVWFGVWGPSYGPLSATEIGLFDGDQNLWAHVAGVTIDLATTTTTTIQWMWTLAAA